MSAGTSAGLLLAGVLWPLVLTVLLAFRVTRPRALRLAPWAALPMLGVGLLLGPGQFSARLPGLLLGSHVGLDGSAPVFLLLAALLWTLAGVYARAWFPQPARRFRFFAFFLPAMAGNLYLVIAQDLIGFYLGFALMSFASYGLVVFSADAMALRAARVYMVLVIVGELLLFTSLLLAAQATDAIDFATVHARLAEAPTRDLVVALGLIGFGIKLGVLGFHVWMPLAYTAAPSPASAVLSGSMVNAGLLGWLRLFPLGEAALPGWGTAMLGLGLGAAFYGVAVGLVQRDPRTLLAYSSISQMGILTLAVGLGLHAPQAWGSILPAIALYALHHGLAKGTLFLGLGLCGTEDRGQRRRVWVGIWLPALALAGAPWTSGMVAKLGLKAQAAHAAAPWDSLLPLALGASTVATALLMARLLYLTRPAAEPAGAAPAADLAWPWAGALAAVALLPWWYAPPGAAAPAHALGALWPVAVAGAAALAAARWWTAPVPAIPAGDVLALLARPWERCRAAARGSLARLVACNASMRARLGRLERPAAAGMVRLARAELRLVRWETALALFVLVALTAGLAAWAMR